MVAVIKKGADIMSQEKVDRYKEEKANRKSIMKKQKIEKIVRRIAVFVVGIVLVGWIGYSAYSAREAKQPKESAVIDYSAVTEYEQNMAAEAE